MFRKNLYESVGGYRKEFKFCQDKDLWIRMTKQMDAYRIPNIYYKQNIDKTSVSSDPKKAKQQYFYTALAKYLSDKTDLEQLDILTKVNKAIITADNFPIPDTIILDRLLRLLQLKRKNEAKSLVSDLSKPFVGSFFYYFIQFFSLNSKLNRFLVLVCKVFQKLNSMVMLKQKIKFIKPSE